MTERRKTDPDAREAERERDNPDAITGAPGSHPVGTGVGAAAGGAAGAAIGAAAGPPGMVAGGVIGAAVGAVAGGYAGKGVAEAINPTAEDAYWREHYHTRPYVQPGTEYDEYRPAYQYGWESRRRYEGRTFEDVEHELRSDWEQRGPAGMDWERAREPIRDSWDRIDRSQPQPQPAQPGAAPSASAPGQPGSAGPPPQQNRM